MSSDRRSPGGARATGSAVSAPAATGGGQNTRLRRALPWLWLALSALWAVVIFVTDAVAWPLALWVATTVGPLTALRTRLASKADRKRATDDSLRSGSGRRKQREQGLVRRLFGWFGLTAL